MYRPVTVREMLFKSAQKFGESCAFTFLDKNGEKIKISYAEFHEDVTRLGLYLLYGLKKRPEKVGIVSFNCYQWCVSYLACLSAGIVAVPIDRELSGDDICDILDFAEVKAVIADKNARVKISGRQELDITDMEEGFSAALEKGRKLKQEGYSLEEIEIDPDKLAVLLFTSGTTGNSKGVMLSNTNLCSDLYLVSKNINITSRDRSLSLLPLHHTYETIAFLMMVYCGGCIAFCKGIRYLGESFRLFSPTVFVTVPLILEKLHEKIMSEAEKMGARQKIRLAGVVSSAISENKKKRLFFDIHQFFGGSLEKIIVGAAALQSSVAEDFELFGFKIVIGYGLTECSPIIICNSTNDRTSDSVGRVLDETYVKLRNTDEKGIGEILVKGPMVMLGYYKNKAATEEVFSDGWFCTGDLGYADKSGRYHISGRCKNVIVTRNGKNVYPEDLEYRLNKSPYITESLVYGEKGDVVSCEVIADKEAIAKKTGKSNPSDEDIKAVINESVRSLNRHLPSYKRIKKVTVRKEEFTKTSTHKIKRKY